MAQKRTFELTTPLGKDVLLFYRMTAIEELGRLGNWHLEALSEKGDVKLDDILAKQVGVKVEMHDGATRHFTGYVTRFAQIGMHGRYHHYRAEVHPWFWFLTRTADCRIFQELTVPDIIKKVFGEFGFTDYKLALTGSFRTRDYCVQYRETDFNFLSRLMEEEGIYYFFKHDQGKNTLMLVNSYSGHSAYPGCEKLPYMAPGRLLRPDQDHLTNWHLEREVQPGKFVLDDYDPLKPSVDLAVNTTISRAHGEAKHEIYDYPGEYTVTADGEHYVKVRAEEAHAQWEICRAETNARGLACGSLLTLSGHPRDDQNREYLIVSAHHEMQSSEYESATGETAAEYACHFTAMHSKQPFRPQRLTRRPFVQGPQTAVVTGPAGDEIYTDKYGRVKVQFFWDREGKKDQNTTCWVRVSHPWAGKNWGMIHIPRIGQEVIVDFLEGDPDQPIITGRVYNAEQMPPWELPGNKTQSGILTRSSLGGSGANANAIRFEDKKGSEQVWIHAEKNQDIEVENDETHWVGHDRKKTIDHDETTLVKHDRTETVDNNETITVHGMRTETVDKNETITIHQNRKERVDINETVSIGANRTEDVGANETITVTANRSVTVNANETKTVAVQRTHTVGANETITVGAAQEITVGAAQAVTVGAAQTVSVGANQSTDVGADQSLSVGGNQSESVSGNASKSVDGNDSLAVKGDKSAKVDGADSTKVTKAFSVDSDDSITLKTGDASITMKKDGTITIKGKDITIQGSGKINVKADSDIVMKGSKILQN